MLITADATITLTVITFKSISAGMMLTTGTSPDVTPGAPQGSARVVQESNKGYKVSGGNPQGNPLILALKVPGYVAVGLITKQVSGPLDNTAFDSYAVGSGANRDTIYVRDIDPVDPVNPTTYQFFVLIRTQTVGQLGDFGLIDPKIINT